MIRRVAILLLCLPLITQILVPSVRAEEINIVITDNGASSSNVATVQSQTTTTVTQNNDATINNNVATDSNTGGNEATQNNGDATISTGNATNTTSITNSDINTNNATSTTCCNLETNVLVSGNGAYSTNTINTTNYNTTYVNQTNKATINNNITVNANTGYNRTNYNGGNSKIITGNIYSDVYISNSQINNTFGDFENGKIKVSAKIKENGADSLNNINFSGDRSVVIKNDNIANINNNVDENLNTGKNFAVGNLGDVTIETGDIKSFIKIKNEKINSNKAVVSCECEEKEKPPTPPTTPPTPPVQPPTTSIVQGASGSSSSSSSSGGGGPAAGERLPVTGGAFYLYLLTLFLFGLFLSGLYLRFHSSNAPPVVA